MIKSKFHKVISIAFVLTLLIPIGVSFEHSFKKHHFENHDDSLQFHVLKNEANCLVYHYLPSLQTLENNSTFSIFFPKINEIENTRIFSIPTINFYSPKQLRAPPTFC